MQHGFTKEMMINISEVRDGGPEARNLVAISSFEGAASEPGFYLGTGGCTGSADHRRPLARKLFPSLT